ncbi:hypothetical protein ACLB2K_024468 [Fragaria x ananassa]
MLTKLFFYLNFLFWQHLGTQLKFQARADAVQPAANDATTTVAPLLPQNEVSTLTDVMIELGVKPRPSISSTYCTSPIPTYGISISCNCSDRQNTVCHITSISLNNIGLPTVIPEEVGALRYLSYLSLSNNKLQGPIPTTLGNLFNLETLTHSAVTRYCPLWAHRASRFCFRQLRSSFPVGHPSWDCSSINMLNLGVPIPSEAAELPKNLVLDWRLVNNLGGVVIWGARRLQEFKVGFKFSEVFVGKRWNTPQSPYAKVDPVSSRRAQVPLKFTNNGPPARPSELNCKECPRNGSARTKGSRALQDKNRARTRNDFAWSRDLARYKTKTELAREMISRGAGISRASYSPRGMTLAIPPRRGAILFSWRRWLLELFVELDDFSRIGEEDLRILTEHPGPGRWRLWCRWDGWACAAACGGRFRGGLELHW